MGDDIVPHLTRVYSDSLYHIEALVLQHIATIESWFRQQWMQTQPPVTSSVDLRHSGFKLAPVDTNLFPAGFNNLHPNSYPLCIQAAQSVFSYIRPESDCSKSCFKILIIPENHTRNQFYFQSLATLYDILTTAGFEVRFGRVDSPLSEDVIFEGLEGQTLTILPLQRHEDTLGLLDFTPCLILLNNDLSTGIPDILNQTKQPILPLPNLGWSNRLKSIHFEHYDDVAHEFAALLGFDPWLINPLFMAVDGVDFMLQTGLSTLAAKTDELLQAIAKKYAAYGIKEKPFVAVKADNGTYGMSVMMVHDGAELLALNRKQRTKMSAIKGSQKVSKILIQEGVHSFETTASGAVAEPVVYMFGPYVIGGFYRVHKERTADENLNAPGMHFEPLAFTGACNTPRADLDAVEFPNRFYVYGVIARLAALAAAREAQSVIVLNE